MFTELRLEKSRSENVGLELLALGANFRFSRQDIVSKPAEAAFSFGAAADGYIADRKANDAAEISVSKNRLQCVEIAARSGIGR
jgi:hypothetical protein